MCSVIGVISRTNADVSEQACKLLCSLKHRGPNAFGVKTQKSEKKAKNIMGLLPLENSSVVLGHCLLSTTGFGVQPFSEGVVSIAHNGQIYNYKDFSPKNVSSDSESIVHFFSGKLKTLSVISAAKLFGKKAIGEYAIGILYKKKLYAIRDFTGQKPIWYGCNDSVCAFASEPAALFQLDIGFPQPLPAGHLLELSANGYKIEKIFTFNEFKKIVPKKYSMQNLSAEFDRAIKMQCSGVKKAAVLFSGGVDSSLIAKAISKHISDVRLFVAGAEGSQDLKNAQHAAAVLGLPLEKIILSQKDVAQLSLKCIKRLVFFDSMQIALAVVEFACSKKISEMGYKVVFSGQGSDEIFLGYSNYLEILKKSGVAALDKNIWVALLRMWSRNFYRDDVIISTFGLELRLPFMMQSFLLEAMAFPVSEKIKSASDSLRKHPLREIAKINGLPDFIVGKEKKAMQYGSGVQKIVSKLFG